MTLIADRRPRRPGGPDHDWGMSFPKTVDPNACSMVDSPSGPTRWASAEIEAPRASVRPDGRRATSEREHERADPVVPTRQERRRQGVTARHQGRRTWGYVLVARGSPGRGVPAWPPSSRTTAKTACRWARPRPRRPPARPLQPPSVRCAARPHPAVSSRPVRPSPSRSGTTRATGPRPGSTRPTSCSRNRLRVLSRGLVAVFQCQSAPLVGDLRSAREPDARHPLEPVEPDLRPCRRHRPRSRAVGRRPAHRRERSRRRARTPPSSRHRRVGSPPIRRFTTHRPGVGARPDRQHAAGADLRLQPRVAGRFGRPDRAAPSTSRSRRPPMSPGPGTRRRSSTSGRTRACPTCSSAGGQTAATTWWCMSVHTFDR